MGNINVVLSTNEDENYIHFWIPVARAYKMIFPDWTINLAFLTNREEDDELVTEFRKYGNVKLYRPVKDVPEFAQAKMIRFILASELEGISYVDDIDLFPLSKEFIVSKLNERPVNRLLCVGGEVYCDNGCYPVSQMTAEQSVWQRLINPKGLSYPDLIEWLKNLPVMFDIRENLCIALDWEMDHYFSDERLLRKLRAINPVPIHEESRGYANYMESTLDRAGWKMDEGKLNSHRYVNAHCCRPYKEEHMIPLFEYLRTNYCTK